MGRVAISGEDVVVVAVVVLHVVPNEEGCVEVGHVEAGGIDPGLGFDVQGALLGPFQCPPGKLCFRYVDEMKKLSPQLPC